MSTLIRSLVISLSIVFLTACGGGGDGDGTTPAVVQTGTFIDSAVENVSYKTETRSGTTNAKGEFSYLNGETVTFSIGSLVLPSVTASQTITPVTLAGAISINDQQALNIARLLISLDADGDPSNGITIPAGAASVATAVDFNVDKATFETNTAVTFLIANSGSVTTTIVSEAVARAHVEESLFNLAGTIVGSWVSAPTTTSSYHKLTLFSDNTFEFFENDFSRTDPENGIETGTYTYNSATGNITFNIMTDENDPGNGSGLGDIGTPAIIPIVLSNNNNSMLVANVIPLVRTSDSITGVWQTANLSHKLTLSSNNTFEYSENDFSLSFPTGENGVESGTYTYNSDTGYITFNITVDTNSPGNSSGLGDIGTPAVIPIVLSNNNNSMLVANVIPLTRTSNVVGVWRIRGISPNLVTHVLSLLPDNTFVYFENDPSAPSPQNGVERGTYTYDPITGNITFNITTDTNDPGNGSGLGDIGTPAIFTLSLSSDFKTLSIVNTPLTFSLDDEFYSKNGPVGLFQLAGDNSYLIIFENTVAGNVLMYTKNNGVEVATFTRPSSNSFRLTKIFTDNSNVLGNTVTSITPTNGPVLTFSVAP